MTDSADDNSSDALRIALEKACLATLLATSYDMLYFKDAQSRFILASRSQADRMGVADPTALVGQSDSDFYDAEFTAQALRVERQIMESGQSVVDYEERETWDDRPDTWVSTTKLPLRDADGHIIGTFGISRDITARKVVEAQLRQRTTDLEEAHRQLQRLEHLRRTLLEGAADPMAILDCDFRYVYVNPAYEELFSLPADQIVGRTSRELGHPARWSDEWETKLARVIQSRDGGELEYVFPSATGERFLQSRLQPEIGPDGDVATILVVTRDLTDRWRAEKALAEQAVHDPLTGLANRVLFIDRLELAFARLRRGPDTIGVIFLDLNRFKLVNDSLGHSVGDALLVEMSRRIVSCARQTDTVSRFGGDEFLVLCEGIARPDDLATIAERITIEIARPFQHAGQEIRVTASLGIAMSTDPTMTAEGLIRNADAAMYAAKATGQGGGSFQFFDEHLHTTSLIQLTLENDLRRAIESQEFCLVFQPLMALKGMGIVGVEALVRWQHPTRGLLLPIEFLAIAEETNLIVQIGRWVIDEACRQLAEWQQGELDPQFVMAINLSARQIAHPQLVHDVAGAIERHGIDPTRLCLEITETAMLVGGLAAIGTFNALHRLGCKIALDDFGTGYSSLGHLSRFPIDILKIDHTFVEGLGRSRGDAAIVAAVTAMAHALGMKAVGEGIETAQQLAELRLLDCDDGQGFLLARPARAAEIAELLWPQTRRVLERAEEDFR